MQITTINHGLKSQRGAALLVCLIILVVITLIGTASMRTSTMEMKMASSQRDRDTAFAAAEAALAAAEDWLDDQPLKENTLLIDSCSPATSCFEITCAGGRCFHGEYSATDTELQCIVGDSSGATPTVDFWSDATLDVWNDNNKHRTITVAGFDAEVKYIVEFLCYVDDEDATVFDSSNPYEGEPLFRVTALAEGNGEKASVMLQSTYMVLPE